ncbi:FAD-dependent oxidoreductase [Mesorhizobium sp. VK25A]|uniref:FAD-dependent oxidoreductase n=1 Tax=Mesorhizobium vachelliae TaxID=3072309 RepID=A0ABU5A786_9HYPH|nr:MULTISPECIES: FAD-dependent oxidoreductase [unclassified Mesorhizobium]MDX8533573.1 FAD-dependent oxidoreductase [Mesorhizobium sp. VK25D]MDX8545937.1 FAD-dependent oxidoreductase [Mesorhizobium sp. VK25A]
MSNIPVENGPVVIVGAGQAGFSVAAKLRDLGHSGRITLVGAEPHPPYQRPPLSKGYLLGDITEERLHLRPLTFYDQKTIELRLGTEVEAIDRDRREARLNDGSVLSYSRLVLATGSRPRLLPPDQGGDLDGVYYLRSIADIQRLAREFVAGRRVVIVGGGYIGLEAAAVSAKLGLGVTLIESAPRILQRVASAHTASFFRELHRSHGVDILEGVGLTRLAGREGRVTGAVLSDGRSLPADFVIVGIGIHPNVELAEMAGLDTENGIAVDAQCRTTDPFILAAGDCASFPWKGRRLRLESVGNAVEQGEAVAKTIMGQPQKYHAEPWFWSDQFDCKLQIAGLGGDHDCAITRQVSDTSLSIWYYRGDDLLAVDAINQPAAYMVGKRLIAQGKSPDRMKVGDAGFELKSLLV